MQDRISGEQLRRNARELNLNFLATRTQNLKERIVAIPPQHPGDLLSVLRSISQNALELGMLDWREGVDPSPQLEIIKNSFDWALEVRPDILPGEQNPDFMAIISSLMGWGLPFDTSPPMNNEVEFAMIWLDRWIIAGLSDPSCWRLKDKAPAPKNRFINQCLEDYWALLTDQVDPIEGMRRCVANYVRRATHPTFNSLPTYLGGGICNELFVDYTLAAIMKNRGIVSNTVHDWIW